MVKLPFFLPAECSVALIYVLIPSRLFEAISFSVGDEDDGVCPVVMMITIIALVVSEQTPPETYLYRHGHSH